MNIHYARLGYDNYRPIVSIEEHCLLSKCSDSLCPDVCNFRGLDFKEREFFKGRPVLVYGFVIFNESASDNEVLEMREWPLVCMENKDDLTQLDASMMRDIQFYGVKGVEYRKQFVALMDLAEKKNELDYFTLFPFFTDNGRQLSLIELVINRQFVLSCWETRPLPDGVDAADWRKHIDRRLIDRMTRKQ